MWRLGASVRLYLGPVALAAPLLDMASVVKSGEDEVSSVGGRVASVAVAAEPGVSGVSEEGSTDGDDEVRPEAVDAQRGAETLG